MAKRKYYYSYEDAAHLKQTFESWIDKMAQTGNGELSVLKDITIKEKKMLFSQDSSLQTYSVEFKFVNSKAIDSSHFLLVNGLTNMVPKNAGPDYNNQTPKLA